MLTIQCLSSALSQLAALTPGKAEPFEGEGWSFRFQVGLAFSLAPLPALGAWVQEPSPCLGGVNGLTPKQQPGWAGEVAWGLGVIQEQRMNK